MMFTYMQCFPVLFMFSTYDCIITFKDQIIDLKGEYLKKKILCGGGQENGVNPFMKKHEFQDDLPTTAVWSYRMEQFQRSDIKIWGGGEEGYI